VIGKHPSSSRQEGNNINSANNERACQSFNSISSINLHLIRKIFIPVVQSLDQGKVLETTVIETRQALKADRILVYRFYNDWSGAIVAESVASGLPEAIEDRFEDPCFRDRYVEQYRNGRINATNNIYEAGLTECHIKTLEKYSVKANLVAPIVRNNQLLGLLIAHQCSNTREWKRLEIELLGQVASLLGLTLEYADSIEQQQIKLRREQQLKDIIKLIRRSLNLKDILTTTVSEVRQALKTDRVLVYRFKTDWSGIIIAESVAAGFPQTVKRKIEDPCFRDHYIEQYQNGRVSAIDDIYKAGLTECHVKTLEQFAVKANLVAPIISDNQLLGLLIAHQCSGARNWNAADLDLFEQVAINVGFALDKAALIENRKAEARRVKLLQEIAFSLDKASREQDILDIAVREARQAIKTDRVLFYCFEANGAGVVKAESVAPGFPQALMQKIEDPCFQENYFQLYQNGRVRAISDIYKAGLATCHINNLERLAVKADLIVPILKNGRLLGLFIAHHCSRAREWYKYETDLFAQIATQVGFALKRVELEEKLELVTQILSQIDEVVTYRQIKNQPNDDIVSEKAQLPEKTKPRCAEVKSLELEKEHDATITFANLPWQ
jgi:twitching motility protein PilJ